MATFYKKENPTSSDNVSAGYELNDLWVNVITYDKYEQISDGDWKWLENKWVLYVPEQGSLTLNEEAETVIVTGDQTIDGVKTFLKSPIVPAPTGDTAVANKKYIDDKVAVIPMAMVFDTVEDLDAWLAITGNTSILNNGVTFYIKDLDVPDYWWNADEQQKEPLEAPKLDLTDYLLTAELYNQPITTVSLPDYEINLEAGEDFTKTCGTGSTFTIINPIIKKPFRLFLTGGTLGATLFTGYNSTWVASTLQTDYNPLIENVLICEIRSAGEITLFWGA